MPLLIVFLSLIPFFLTASLSKLTIEEKVGQVIMVHFYGETENEDARKLIQDIRVGGIIYFNWSNGLTSRSQVKNLSHNLQELTYDNPHPIPLLIATDQEGGKVSRLNSPCFTKSPGNRYLGETDDLEAAKEIAYQMGKEMKCVGIQLNLSPVVDIATTENSPLIDRSFGSDPQKVTAFGKSFLEGFREANIFTTLKHFPGHGAVDVDSHRDLPYCLKSLSELEEFELVPFKELHPLADAIMTGHILVEALDKESCATLSKKTLTHYLRDTLGFQGVIISDSLAMQAVLKTCKTVDEAAIQALIAGCDILLLGGAEITRGDIHFEVTTPDVKRIHNSLVTAVKEGRISMERLDDAVSRILLLKERLF